MVIHIYRQSILSFKRAHWNLLKHCVMNGKKLRSSRIILRKRNLLKNKLSVEKNDGVLFSFGYTSGSAGGARMYMCACATFTLLLPPCATTLGRARVCTTSIFSSLRHQSFFARIYLPTLERARGERFLGGLISLQFVFAVAKVRVAEPRCTLSLCEPKRYLAKWNDIINNAL